MNKLCALHAPEVECLAKVRRGVANIIVSAAQKVDDESGRSVGRNRAYRSPVIRSNVNERIKLSAVLVT